jgi:hypothetical protein
MPVAAVLNAERMRSMGPWALALGIELALVYIVCLGDLRAHIYDFWLGVTAVCALYGLAIWWLLRKRGGSTRTVLLCAILFRLTMWHSPASLSDDIYRYVWDGRVQLAGINPYRYAPDDEALSALRDESFEQINHRHIPTIYPPLAQAFFTLAASLHQDPATVKLGLIFIDIGLCFLLARFLALRQMDPRRVVLYAWHPLPLIEIAGSGHIDALGIACMLAALYALALDRPALASALLAAATLAKLIPIILLPLFWLYVGQASKQDLRSVFNPRSRAALWAFPACVLIGFLPYINIGTELLSGLLTYVRHWHFNDMAYTVLYQSLFYIDPAIAQHTRWLCSLLFLIALVYALRYVDDPLRTAYWSFGAYILLSPTVHPWYMLWILPFMPFFPSAAWIALSSLVFLAYEILIDYSLGGAWIEKPWVRWAQYAPFFVLLTWTALTRYIRVSRPQNGRSDSLQI